MLIYLLRKLLIFLIVFTSLDLSLLLFNIVFWIEIKWPTFTLYIMCFSLGMNQRQCTIQKQVHYTQDVITSLWKMRLYCL